VSGLYGNVVD
jgi:hypothetical protein